VPDYNLCDFDANEQRLGDCAPTAEGVELTCAQSGDLKGRCLQADGKNPVVGHADPVALVIRVVFGVLLNGKTVEEFACACQGDSLATIDPANCSPGAAWSADPFNCSTCGGGADVAGQCLDTDLNGLPDVTALLPGVATITCGTDLTYPIKLGEGLYSPSGNGQPSSQIGLGGLGPALQLEPGQTLPTNTQCSVSISDSVKDKQGRSIDQTNGPFLFITDALGVDVANSAPADGDEAVDGTDPDGAVAAAAAAKPPTVADPEITVHFNAPIDKTVTASSFAIKGTSTTTDTAMTVTPIATPAIKAIAIDGQDVFVHFAGPLPASTVDAVVTITVTVKTTVVDEGFKKPLKTETTYAFTTDTAK